MIKFTTRKCHLPWIRFNHSLKTEAIDTTYNKQTSTWIAADQKQSEEIHFLLSLKTFWASFWGIFQILCCLLPLCICGHSQQHPEGCLVMNQKGRKLNKPLIKKKPGKSFCSPFSRRQLWAAWTSYQTCSLSHDYLSNGLRKAYQKWPFCNKKLKLGLLFRMCVCVHRGRLKWFLTSRNKNNEMGFKLMAVNTVKPFS